MHSPISRRRRQGGFTIIEIMVVVVIGLLLFASAYALAPGLFRMLTGGTTANNLFALRANIQSRFDSQRTCEDLTDNFVTDAGLAPDGMVAGDGDIRNEWNGDVTFGPNGADNTLCDIQSDEIPQTHCISLGEYSDTQWEEVSINGTTVDGTPGDAQANCVDGDNTLTFTMRKG